MTTATTPRPPGSSGPSSGPETAGRAERADRAPSPTASAAAPDADTPPGALEAAAAEAVLGANPFVGLNLAQAVQAAGRLLTRLGVKPKVVARHTARLAAELARVLVGRSSVAPAKGDKRWSDPAWQENPAYRRLQQAYLAICQELDRAIDDAGLDVKSDLRGRFAMAIVTEALAPTNTVINPSALKRAFDTGGASIWRGAKHFVSDLRHNGGMPTTVDRSPFVVGETVARTPGAVVFRNEVLELVQYSPTTERVREVPLVYLPPQINKFYILELAPGRSLIEYMVGQGFTWFTVCWCNPGKQHADLVLFTYAGAIL